MFQTIDHAENFAIDLSKRPRRNRKSAALREMLQETRLHSSHFVAPLFVTEGTLQRQPISSLPGVYRLSIDTLLKEVEDHLNVGVRAVVLFPVISMDLKDAHGSEACRKSNLLVRSIKAIKQAFPEMCVMADIALDPYTDHGHDGLINSAYEVLNDPTLRILGEMSLLLADAGADVLAPSDMMDGRVGYIRNVLDQGGFQEVSILAYAAKYASAFYGPFREALQSSPKGGDKKGYQLNPANWKEAMRECAMDEIESADMLLIKPALPYLDIIAKVKEKTHLPVGAFHVSGEYAMVKAAAQNGWIDEHSVMHECLLSIKRAGADFILTYAAKQMAHYLS